MRASAQNFAAAVSSVPQLAQRAANAVPHSMQNFARSGHSDQHFAQFMH